MNREDIIKLAHEAQFEGFGNSDWVCTTEEIERFADLVAAAAVASEREACAKVCESRLGPTATAYYGKTYAAAIRARGN